MLNIWAVFDDEHGVVSIWDTREKAMDEVKKTYIGEDIEVTYPPEITEDNNVIVYDFNGFKVWICPEPLNESNGWYY